MPARRPSARAPHLEALEPRRLLTAWIVSSLADVSDGNHADGELSLREAVELANAAPGHDTIRFKSDTGGSEVRSDITITDDLTIEGIDENGNRTGFWLSPEIWGGSGNLVLDDGDDFSVITVTIDGMRSGNNSLTDAVGLVSRESLEFLNGEMGNEFYFPPDYPSDDATIRHTGTTPDARLVVRNSWFRTVDYTAVTATGPGSVIIDASEFTLCSAVSVDGAESVLVTNSTFSRSSGLRLDLPSGAAVVSNSTFFANRPRAIHLLAGTLVLNSSLLAWNGTYTDVYAPSEMLIDPGATLDLESSRNNLVLDAASAGGLINGENGNILGVAPRLAPLADNGGPTRTHALYKSSPAINTGNNDLGLEFDQRGRDREVGPPDIGAYERFAAAFVVDSLADTDDGDYSAGNFTLREAIALTSATPEPDIIFFDPSLAGETIRIGSRLIIAGPLDLRGLDLGPVTIDAGGASTIFSVSDGDDESAPISISISNVRLVNSFGSAIFNAESLTLDHVEFADCVSSWSGGEGSAIQSVGPLDIRSSTFTGNVANRNGGAISSIGVLMIADSSFSSNSAAEDGGAIWSRAPATITDCTFEANTAGDRGGAIFVPGAPLASLVVAQSSFSGNAATTGGAIHADRVALEIAHSSFNGNSASEDGGAIAGHGSISDSIFDGNTAGRDGGAIHTDTAPETLALTGSVFRDNHAGASGGAMNAGALEVSESTFLGNSAESGGALHARGFFVLDACRFEANTASADGGAILNQAALYIRRSMFSANEGSRGGALFNHGHADIDGSTFTGNAASTSGGAIYNNGDARAVVTISSSTLDNNGAARDGGAIWTNGLFLATNSTISANTANGYGGGIAIAGEETHLTFCTIAFNRCDADADASGDGGGVHVGSRAGRGLLLTSHTIYANNVRWTDITLPNDLGFYGAGKPLPQSDHNLIAQDTSFGEWFPASLGNIIGEDPLLEPLGDNGGPTRTHAIAPGSPALDAGDPERTGTDQRGIPRPAGAAADIGAFEWGSLTAHDDARIDADSNTAGVLDIVVWSIDGEWIVFRGQSTGQAEQWSASFPTADDDAPTPTANAVLWIDPATGLSHVAGPTDAGFVLYTRAAGGQWTRRNLSAELDVSADSPTRALTQFLTPAGLALVAGYNDAGEIVAFREVFSGGRPVWAFTNISADLASQGMTTPQMTDLVGYATPWNALNIVGIDASGDIQVAWIHPATFTTWRIDNLSGRTGAPPLVGQLTVTQTAWRAVNIGGLDSRGHVMITWWVPARGPQWTTSDLTAASGGPALAGAALTGFVTRWGAINYAGTTEDGAVAAYWWTGRTGWQSDTLLDSDAWRPTTTLASHVSPDGAISILGASADNQIMRLWWSPHTNNAWLLSNLSLIATT